MYCRWLSGSHATRLNIYIRTHKHGCSSDAFGAFMTANCAFPPTPPPTPPYPTVMSAGKPRRPRRLWCVCLWGTRIGRQFGYSTSIDNYTDLKYVYVRVCTLTHYPSRHPHKARSDPHFSSFLVSSLIPSAQLLVGCLCRHGGIRSSSP